MFKGRVARQEEIARLKAQTLAQQLILDQANKDLVALRGQVTYLMDAMTSKVAPIAYRDKKADDLYKAQSSEAPDQMAKLIVKAEEEYIRMQEEPTFEDAEHMLGMMRDLGVAATDGIHSSEVSIHGNSES